MGESRTDISVAETQLTVCVASANKDIACLSLNHRVVLASGDLLNFLTSQVLDEFRCEDILSRTMS